MSVCQEGTQSQFIEMVNMKYENKVGNMVPFRVTNLLQQGHSTAL
jgi:hypothetical protein